MSSTTQVCIGIEVDASDSAALDRLILAAQSAGYDFVQSSITSALLHTATVQALASSANAGLSDQQGLLSDRAFALEHLVIDRAEFSRAVIGRHASWASLANTNATTRVVAESTLRREAAWAAHIGLGATVISLPHRLEDVPSLARYVANVVATPSHTQLMVHVSMVPTTTGVDEAGDGAWERWTLLRALCAHSPHVVLALELTADLPDESRVGRWLAEPIAAVILPADIWLRNAKGYPVLGRRHQQTVRQFLARSPRIIIRADVSPMEERATRYQQYVRHLSKTPPSAGACEMFADGYQDYLQAPLQPLMDNLESATYQVFEQDPVKYAQYEEAVYRAILDRPSTSPDTTIVIVVVGAGRGPLVTRSLRAADRAKRPVEVYAVEKNPNAFVTLQRIKREEWKERVTLVWSDMRDWVTEVRADILVSELLGSFGDNELSPECLDGAQKLLKSDGISIPSAYTSYLAPLSSAKLYAETGALCKEGRYETPYVVLFRAVHQVAEPQAVWTFTHPIRDPETDAITPPCASNLHNAREASLTFTSSSGALLHGLAGYFDTILYKDVVLSIRPDTASEGMFSWFPIYFPFKTPIYAPANTKISVQMWRRSNVRKAWYEWAAMVTEPSESTQSRLLAATTIHNVGGNSYWIGL